MFYFITEPVRPIPTLKKIFNVVRLVNCPINWIASWEFCLKFLELFSHLRSVEDMIVCVCCLSSSVWQWKLSWLHCIFIINNYFLLPVKEGLNEKWKKITFHDWFLYISFKVEKYELRKISFFKAYQRRYRELCQK